MKQYIYTIYLEDGSIRYDGPRAKMTLQELQSQVGGLIEVLPKPFYGDTIQNKRATAFINEEGKLEGMKPNPHFDSIPDDWELGGGDFIVGPVIVEEVHHG